MTPVVVLVVYGTLVTGASLLGGWLPIVMRPSHTRMQFLMSFLGGLMMGVAILHLVPHAVVQLEDIDSAMFATLIGLLATLFLVRCFHFHQHDVPDAAPSGECAHDHCHPHDHPHAVEKPDAGQAQRFSWIGLFLGLTFHTLMDGVALGASVAAEGDASGGLWGGLGTFLAVALHKPLDSLSITVLMTYRGWSRRSASLVNVAYALICPIGALVFFFGLAQTSGQAAIIGWALGLSAGVFLCIALVDVMPEIQFHSHDRLGLSIALLAGVATAYAIGLAETQHAHDLHRSHPTHAHPPHE